METKDQESDTVRAAVETAEFQPGDSIGKYIVREVLGEGGFAVLLAFALVVLALKV